MAGGSESRRSMASASVAAHRAEANVADARLARYNDRIGRVRKERAVWPGAAFIVEALLLLVFLTGSLAVLMNLNAEADRIGRESADLMDGLVLASNVAEEFAADPIAFKEAYEADPMADRWLSQPAHEVENGSDLLSAECTFRTEDTEAGTMHYLTLEVWKVRVLNDSAKAAEEGIGFAPWRSLLREVGREPRVRAGDVALCARRRCPYRPFGYRCGRRCDAVGRAG